MKYCLCDSVGATQFEIGFVRLMDLRILPKQFQRSTNPMNPNSGILN